MDEAEFAAVLEQARAGSKEAMGQLFELCRGYLLMIARHEHDLGLQAKQDSLDLVQDTIMEAHRDFAGFHGTTEPEFLAWMRRLLVNNLANFARSFRHTDKRAIARELSLDDWRSPALLEPAGDESTPSGVAMAHEQIKAIERTLAGLPENYQRVITLRYHEERGWEEIGNSLGCTANAARKLWLRAVEQLREQMQEGSSAF